MLQLIENGPIIPSAVIKALEEQKLVFFCGAGISMYTGLDDFGSLVKSVSTNINIKLTNPMKQAQKDKKWDEFLNLLEKEAIPGKVRQLVKDELTRTSQVDLNLHKALLGLSKVGNSYRLVTTNFDRRFLETGMINTSQIHSAPALPIPDLHTWSSVVHLHGLIDDNNSLDNLVLTSADFGNAYLKHAQASKFLIELFRNFTVVFIGYSVSDPIVKYLVDAIAVNEDNENRMFAFASYNQGNKNDVVDIWASKNITPILYKEDNSHSDLYQTIVKLDEYYNNTTEKAKEIINNHYQVVPKEIDFNEMQMLWALSKVGIKYWSELDPTAPLEWLFNVFDNQIENNELDAKNTFNYFQNKISESILTLFKYQQNYNNARLTQDSCYFAIWLSKYLNKPKLLGWVLNKGGVIHPFFAGQINRMLKSNDLHKGLKLIWFSIASIATQLKVSYENFELLDFLPEGCPNQIVINNLLELLKPRLNLKITEDSKNLYKIIDAIDDDSALNFIEPEIYLGTDRIGFKDYLKEHLENETILCSLCNYLSQYLKQSIDLLSMFDESFKSHYGACSTYLDLNQENIGGFNTKKENFLIYLLIKSFNALIAKDPKQAIANLVYWQQYDSIIFTRLTLHFMAIHYNQIDINMFVNKLLETKPEFLLTPYYKNECLYFLKQAGNLLDKITLKKIVDTIFISKLPQDVFYSEVTNDIKEKINNDEKCRRLLSLKLSGAKLSKQALKFFGEYKENPEIKNLQEGTNFNLADMKIKPGDFLYEFLNTSSTTENKGILDRIMEEVLNETNYSTDFKFLNNYTNNTTNCVLWSEAFNNISNQSNLSVTQLKNAFDFVEYFYSLNLPLDVLKNLEGIIIQCLNKLISLINDSNFEECLTLFESMWSIASGQNFFTKDLKNVFEDAFNYPAGVLTKLILSYLDRLKLKFQEGIPEKILKLINLIVHSNDSCALYGQVILASELNYFYEIDMTWAKNNLLPKFKVGKDFNISYWYAYLSQPYISRGLFLELKNDFIECLRVKDKFDNQRYYSLVKLFTTCYLNYNELFDDAYTKDFVLILDETSLNTLACIFKDILYNAGENAAELWVTSLSKAFHKLWNHQKIFYEFIESKSGSKQYKEKLETSNRLKSKTMFTLIHMVLETKDAIPAATQTVLPFIFKTKYIDYTLIQLIKNHQFGSKFPESMIKLLTAYMGKSIEPVPSWFEGYLDQIENSYPEITNSADFKYLRSLNYC